MQGGAKNTIALRIATFLKDFMPFSLLRRELLLEMAAGVEVRYLEAGDILFEQGTSPGASVFVLREGAVQLLRQNESGVESLIDTCDEGDLFGIRPLMAGQEYALTAKAVEESLVYVIQAALFRKAMEQNPEVTYYLASAFASGLHHIDYANLYRGRIFPQSTVSNTEAAYHLLEVQGVEALRTPVCCLPGIKIREAAGIMSRENVSSIIVIDSKQLPVGIVTDKDLRHRVATGEVGIGEAVRSIMSSPVVTIAPELTVADVQMKMVQHRIHHLCITEDGTSQSQVCGVITEHDLLVLQANNPAILVRQIRRTRRIAELEKIRAQAEILLKKYLYQEVSIGFISGVMTEINDALIYRVIELSLEEMDAEETYSRPAQGFCWLALGSEGRGEQLLRTDQDSALVFEDSPSGTYKEVKSYYLELAGRVTAKLNECGFEFCPANMMGSNPDYCLSLSEWKRQFGKWIEEPSPEAVMYSTIFFDFRAVFGQKELADELTKFIFERLDQPNLFLQFLAKNALQNPPPLSFFRNFVVEKSGEHKDAFDIKARAMMPLTDAARLLVLSARVGHINNTFRRFDKLAELEPNNRELYEQAADAYEVLMRYRALEGLRNESSGRYFRPEDLTKMQRLHLRNAFRPIRELQSLITVRFNLSLLR